MLKTFLALISAVSLMQLCQARTWTDTTGRKIEADILSVKGDQVSLQFKGKPILYPINKLSKADQEFIKSWAEKPADQPAQELSILGTPLKPNGATTIIEKDLEPESVKAFGKSPYKANKLKLAIALPKDFDPTKANRVMWVSAPINNAGERKRGNIAAMNVFAPTATQAGWVVVAADSELGNPRPEDNLIADKGDLALQTEAIQVLAKTWPKFTDWEFACCGGSGGAKLSFTRVGQLLASDLNVIGLFLAGCNQDLTENARKEARYRKSLLRNVKVWISNGRTDTVSTVQHAESVKKSVKSNRYGEVRLELFDGGHQMKKEEFAKAIQWFVE